VTYTATKVNTYLIISEVSYVKFRILFLDRRLGLVSGFIFFCLYQAFSALHFRLKYVILLYSIGGDEVLD